MASRDGCRTLAEAAAAEARELEKNHERAIDCPEDCGLDCESCILGQKNYKLNRVTWAFEREKGAE